MGSLLSTLVKTEEDMDECDSGVSNIRVESHSRVEEIPTKGIHAKAYSIDYRKYVYPFENLVLEGGGSKGLAYVGAVRVLEELNMTVANGRVKRLAGTSAGAMTATLLAIGYDSYQLEAVLSSDIEDIFLDSRFGYLSLIPNIIEYYGWNPGEKVYEWFGNKIQEQLKSPDATFLDLYKDREVELCVVVVNLNTRQVEYCHHKTTPDMPIRLAVRMSISIPMMFAPKTCAIGDETDYYVDGGVVCNFPIHVYDGWWLSCKKEDSFFSRIKSVKEISADLRKNSFKGYNNKTLGFMVYSDNEEDLYRSKMQSRYGTKLFPEDIPDTEIGKRFKEKAEKEKKHMIEYRNLVDAADAFLSALDKCDKNNDSRITFDEFMTFINDPNALSDSQKLILFEEEQNAGKVFHLLSGHDDTITFRDIVTYLEKRGLNIQKRLMGYQRTDIDSFSSYIDSIQCTLLTNAGRLFMEQQDVKRTVGINTGHIGTTNFQLEKEDIKFTIERGRKSTEAFLRYFVVWNNLKPQI